MSAPWLFLSTLSELLQRNNNLLGMINLMLKQVSEITM